MRGPVARDAVSYRRGLVLGLTMAEIMLLLLFCLLIGFAALLQKERRTAAAAERRADTLALEDDGRRALLDRLGGPDALAERAGAAAGAAGSVRIDDTWRHLVADAGLVARLKAAGVDTDGLAARDLAADLALADAAKAVLADAAPAADGDPRTRLAAALDAVKADRARTRALEDEVAALAARAGKPVDLPPIIMLREDRGFRFESGSAVLSEKAAAKLHDETVASLVDLVGRYDVDVIEVIGHTDEQPVGTSHVSNLDQSLLAVVGGAPIESLSAADNAGLGLARAVSVARLLKSDARLKGVEILPLSAAQLVGTDGRLTAGGGGNEPDRRRIEIRLRRSVDAREAAPDGPPPGTTGAPSG